MKLKKSLIAGLLVLSTQAAQAYNVVDRFKLIDDKFKTDQMLNDFGHDFLFDVNASLNKNVTDVISDVKDANDLTSAQNILTKYDKTEQTIRLNLNIGFPLPRFTAFGVTVIPNVRVNANVGANIGIRSETLTPAMLLELVNIDLPTELKNKILATTYTGGEDLLKNSVCSSLSDAAAQTLCYANQNKYFYPTNTNVPNLLLFAKVDARAGLYNQYTYGEHFFGNFNLYALSRTDVFQRINANMIANGSEIELPKKKNTEMAAMADYNLGYKNSNYTVSLGVEDLKLVKLKEKEAGAKELSYGYDPLIRLHADASYRFTALSLQPFAGVHKRSGYGFADGVYVGAIAGAHVWGDRLGLSLRGMLDKQYLTINPRIKLWLMQLEYSLKNPVKSTDGDVKLSAIHSIDFRLFF